MYKSRELIIAFASLSSCMLLHEFPQMKPPSPHRKWLSATRVCVRSNNSVYICMHCIEPCNFPRDNDDCRVSFGVCSCSTQFRCQLQHLCSYSRRESASANPCTHRPANSYVTGQSGSIRIGCGTYQLDWRILSVFLNVDGLHDVFCSLDLSPRIT